MPQPFFTMKPILTFLRQCAARLILPRGVPKTEPNMSTDFDPSIKAWNNFISESSPDACEEGSTRWAAAIAADAQGLILNGGMNSFLSQSWEIDPRRVVRAFAIIGAKRAANELKFILDQLGQPLPMSPQKRWDVMTNLWLDSLNERDGLSDEADAELQAMLEAHVAADRSFYLAMT